MNTMIIFQQVKQRLSAQSLGGACYSLYSAQDFGSHRAAECDSERIGMCVS